MKAIPDPRKQEQCTYDIRHFLWLGILLFIFRLKSRRQLQEESRSECFRSNLLNLSGSSEEDVAHTDTLNSILEDIAPRHLEKLKASMVKNLIKEKRLERFRLLGGFTVAIDATGVYSFSKKHCDYCLRFEHKDGSVSWRHMMLEAKLVSESGMAFSICSEPVENETPDWDKQDCELKAFYRMSARLKQSFKRTPICLLLDGLYACAKVMEICHKNCWNFIIVFKDGSIPTLHAEALKLRNTRPKQSITVHREDGATQKLSWVTDLRYEGRRVNVIFCEETKQDGSISEWCWLTDISPDAHNIEEIVNNGARQRWKIENQGFNEQKRHSFELEHPYGKAENAWKNYYQLLQIAHTISQLMTHGDLCAKLQKLASDGRAVPFMEYYKSVRNFIRRICESFRNTLFSNSAKALLEGKIQIRLDSG
jgi:hypothetical protein